MKIAFVSPHSFSYPGGVQEHIICLKKEFEKKGHKVKIIAPGSKIWFKELKKEDFLFFGKIFNLHISGTKVTLSFALDKKNIIKRIKEEGFDLLHFQNFEPLLSFSVLDIGKLLGLPCILTFHAFFKNSILYKFIPFLNKLIFEKFDGIICTSKAVLSQLKYSGLVEVIPNGVDIDFFGQKQQAAGSKRQAAINRQHAAYRRSSVVSNQSPVNILFVGRLEERKGLIYLVKAFEILRKRYNYLKLIVAGEGKERRKIENYARSNGLRDVYFEGEVKREDLPGYYQDADICCFPSIYGEGFGMVLLEAMAAGKPVAAFSNEGYKEVLIGKGAEFLAAPRDIEGLAGRIEALIKDKSVREEMGKWGRQEAEKYSWLRVAGENLNFYEKVVKLNSKNF